MTINKTEPDSRRMTGTSFRHSLNLNLLKSNRTIITAIVLVLIIPAIVSPAQEKKADKVTLNVLDFGAKGDGVSPDSKAIQNAIDSAASLGNGTVVFIPGGRRYLTGTIQLKSHIDFHLHGDAELFISTDRDDYVNDAVITANGANGLKITGTGSINGRDLEFMSHYEEQNEWWIPREWRPKIFVLTRCNNLEIRDITFGYAPFWGLHMIGCENVVIDNITIRNNLEVPNCDGIDPDHCRNVVISNCDIVSGDDAIVIKATRQTEDYGPSANIHVKDCLLRTQDAGVKIGTETTRDIHDILFERCKITTSSRGISIQLRDEGDVYNIRFRDIEFISRYYSDPWWGRGEAISLTAIKRLPETTIGRMYNISFENIKGQSENSLRINGTAESRIRDVTLKNVNLLLNKSTKYKGGLFDNRPSRTYTEIEAANNPGISLRNADNVTIENCSISWGENRPDYYSNAIKASDCTGVEIINFNGEAAHPKHDAIINE